MNSDDSAVLNDDKVLAGRTAEIIVAKVHDVAYELYELDVSQTLAELRDDPRGAEVIDVFRNLVIEHTFQSALEASRKYRETSRLRGRFVHSHKGKRKRQHVIDKTYWF